jgi:hypothetical protein
MRVVKNFGVSCLSASLAHIPHHPLYTLKSQMMYYGKEFRFTSFVRRAWNTRGLFLFQGVLPRSIGIAPEKALKMAAWEGGISLVNYAYPQCPKSLQWMFAGSMAGAATTIIGCPSERAMVLAQIQKKGFVDVLRNAGIRGLYHGAEATLYRDISFNMCLFALRAFVMRWYENRFGEEPSAMAKVWWGLPASVIAGIVACPFDVVKTRIQGKELQELGSGSRRPIPLMVQIARQEGVRYLFKGLLPRLIAVPLYMSVFITVNEELQKYLLGTRISS